MVNQRRAGVIIGYANIVTKNLVNLVYTPLLLSFVGKADYGVYQSCNSFVFSLTLLSFGFSQAYIRFYTQRKVNGSKGDVDRLNGVYIVLYAVVSVMALLLGLFFAENAGTIFSAGFNAAQIDIAKKVIAVLSASIAITLFNSVFDAFILAHEQFCFQQTRQLITTLATPFTAFWLLRLGFGVVGVAIAQLIVSAVLLSLNASYCIRKLEMRFDVIHFDFRLFRAIAVFSGWVFINQVCDIVNQNVPNVLLGALASASAVAIFAIAVQIRNVFMSLSTTMSTVFMPEINRIVAESNDNKALTKIMTRAGRYQMILFCWVYGGFVVLGRFFIHAWAGEGFADAYWLILFMTLPLVVPLTQNTGIEIQRAKNKHKARSAAMFVAAVGNVLLTVATAPSLGFWAPAIGYIASIGLCNGIFMNWYYQRHIGLDMGYFWRNCLPVLLGCAIVTSTCVAATSILPVSNWISFLVMGIVYTVLFLISVWKFALDPAERNKILNWLV